MLNKHILNNIIFYLIILQVLPFFLSQASECAIWQEILLGNTIWSLQEEKKVLFFGSFYITFLKIDYPHINSLLILNMKYIEWIDYNLCSLIDSSRIYSPPDPPGYFDGHVWPMYLRNRQEMESLVSGIGEHLCAIFKDDVIKNMIMLLLLLHLG